MVALGYLGQRGKLLKLVCIRGDELANGHRKVMRFIKHCDALLPCGLIELEAG